MPASVAEAYMLAIGTALPIIGESFAPPFVGMIQLDGFDWQLRPPELDENTASRTPGGGGASSTEDREPGRAEAPPFDGRSLIERVIRTMRDTRLDQRRREEEVRRHIQRATAEHDRERESADRANSEEGTDDADTDRDDESNKPELIFKFTKNADISTSQLLSQMANGQPLKEVHITLFHRSLHAPMTLLVSFKTVRLTSYAVECDAEEAMSDVKESWSATYKSVKFMYQNRPPLGLPYSIASTVALATTQGRIKEFQMKVRDPENPDEEW